MRLRGLLFAGLLLITSACTQAAGVAASPAPSLGDPKAAAQPLVSRFFELVHNKDVALLSG